MAACTLVKYHRCLVYGFKLLCDNIVTCMSDYGQGFELEIGLIEHFNTRLMTKIRYSSIADLHILQITTAQAKSFQCAVSSPTVHW
jgi:hypothetical protein